MKILIITAHPSPKGFTHRIASTYKKAGEEIGHQVEILDLYRTNLKQGFLEFEDIKAMPADPVRDKIQAMISEADELVFIHPLWWLSMPAIMKNFIDINISAGFAYKFNKNHKTIGLLKTKTARVFITSDGSKYLFKFIFSPFKLVWKYGILGFCGMKLKPFRLYDRMRWRDEEEKGRWLDEVEKLANN